MEGLLSEEICWENKGSRIGSGESHTEMGVQLKLQVSLFSWGAQKCEWHHRDLCPLRQAGWAFIVPSLTSSYPAAWPKISQVSLDKALSPGQ